MALVSGSSAVLDEGVRTPRRNGVVMAGRTGSGEGAGGAIFAEMVKTVYISVNTMFDRTIVDDDVDTTPSRPAS
jgi:hypothetical protein